MAYKNTLTDEQKEYIYNETDCKNKQNKIKSIWSYMIKYEGKGKSTNRLYCMYVIYHPTISKSYFYDIVNFINSYGVKSERKSERKSETLNPIESVEIKGFEPSRNSCKNKDKVNIYNNTLYTDFVSVNELTVFAELLMDELKIKSLFVRTLVTKNLSMKTGINRVGMLAYVTKAIGNAKALLDMSRSQFVVARNKKFNELKETKNKNNAGNLLFNMEMSRNYSDDFYNDIERKFQDKYCPQY